MTDQERDKRLIETALPLEKVSEESSNEQYRSYGRLTNLQKWWALRPLSASRVAAYASLVPEPEDESSREDQMDFVGDLAEWENMHNQQIIRKASERVKDYCEGDQPKILDPFSGAGSLPLEGKRIGCESHALEYNPVAYLINEGVLIHPDKGHKDDRETLSEHVFNVVEDDSKLIKDFKEWAGRVYDQVSEKIDEIYGDNEVGYIWSRTLPCPNPNCELDIPLVKTFWLVNKESKKRFCHVECHKNGDIEIDIIKENEFEEVSDSDKDGVKIKQNGAIFDPSDGTVQRGSVSCPACGNSFKSEKTREISNKNGFGEILLAIIKEEDEKEYYIPTEEDYERIEATKRKLDELDSDWIPDEEIPSHENTSRYLTPRHYGLETWGEIFNPRQRLTLALFSKNINEIHGDIVQEVDDEEYANAIVTYLSFALTKMADYNSTLVAWGQEKRSKNTFTRTALPMKWDYVERNPLAEGSSGSWDAALDLIPRAINTASGTEGTAEVHLGSANRLPFEDNEFDAILTDPPYYDNVPYAALSDFFYVWMKRSLGDIYPEAFSTPLTPKGSEIIQDKGQHGSQSEAEEFYERELSNAFSEMNRVLKEDGITTIVFAHKSSEAWAQMIRSLLDSGLVVTATWPIHTEKRNRVRSMGSASLASSIYFVCRNRSGSEVGYYSDVQEELEERIHERLDYFWNQGIRGADLLVSAIGPATEIFGQYETVKRLSGEEITVDELLEDTQRLVSDYALGKVLEGDVELGSIDPETRFYILYRWAFANQKEDYDEVRKLAQVNEADTERLERLGILDVSRGDAVMNPPQNRDIDDPAEIPEGNNLPLVDKIQRAAILWESGQREKLKTFIEEHGMDEEFWRSAQAISETLPEEEKKSQKEKQMLHGLLGYGGQTEFEASGQSTLGKYTDGGEDQ